MRILIVSATRLELGPFLERENLTIANNRASLIKNGNEFEILICGVGMVAAGVTVANELSKSVFHLVLNIGFAGSFSKNCQLGSLVLVTTDQFVDIGVEQNDKTNPISKLRLSDLKDEVLLAKFDSFTQYFTGLPSLVGITKNTISTKNSTISYLKREYQAGVETMEGAAIFYAALFANTEFVQVRALSNYVGERDKSHWEIKGCLEAISNYLEGFINELKTSNGGAE